MSENGEINYWKLQKDELLRRLNTSTMGLDEAEAARALLLEARLGGHIAELYYTYIRRISLYYRAILSF